MGIHYDYKSKRGERAMLKESKRKARLAQRKEKKLLSSEPVDPIVLKSSTIVNTSFTIGIFLITTFLFVNIVDANIGSVAFFEPEIMIVPDIFRPPLISNFSI